MARYRNENGVWVDEPEEVNEAEQEQQQRINQVNEFMRNFTLSNESKVILDDFNHTVAAGGVSPMTEQDVFNFVMSCKYDEIVNGVPLAQAYRRVYSETLSQKLSDYVRHTNECSVNGQPVNNDEINIVSISDKFENLVQGIYSNLNNSEAIPDNGGLNANEMYELQNRQYANMLTTKSKVAYARDSANGTRTVAETCQAARNVVQNAYREEQLLTVNTRTYDVSKAVATIRGLQDVHASRSWGWFFRHPVNYIKEAIAISKMKKDAVRLSGFSKEHIERRVNARERLLPFAENDNNNISLRAVNENMAESELDKADEIERQRNAIEARMAQKKLQDDMDAKRANDEVNEDLQAARDLGLIDEQGNSIEPVNEDSEERQPLDIEDPEKSNSSQVSEKVDEAKKAPQIESVPKK
ncbi:MAG: hypothetical protein ACI4QN_01015 [Candidatus Coproplasma sp.]